MVANLLIAVVALEHLGFLVLEMFLWTRPVGLRVFRQSAADAKVSKVLAGNQGLYNGFLSAGLIWSLLQPDSGFAFQLKLFFLGCVVIAGTYGACTVSRRILLMQAAPAALAIGCLLLF